MFCLDTYKGSNLIIPKKQWLPESYNNFIKNIRIYCARRIYAVSIKMVHQFEMTFDGR